jgi:hypothetical protein
MTTSLVIYYSAFYFAGVIRKGITLRRVPEIISSRLNWVPPPPHLQASVSPPQVLGGRHTRKWGESGGPNSDDWTETLVLYIV